MPAAAEQSGVSPAIDWPTIALVDGNPGRETVMVYSGSLVVRGNGLATITAIPTAETPSGSWSKMRYP